MDTLSTSVPNFQVPKSFNHATHSHRTISPVRRHHHLTTTAGGKASINSKPPSASFTHVYPNNSRRIPSLSPPFTAPRASFHRGASSGYAAALADVAQSKGVIVAVAKDVRRLLRVLRNEQVRELMMDDDGIVVMEFLEKGKFEVHLVELVKMVIEKGKSVDLVKEILEEFHNIFYQITITHVPTALPAK